MLLLAHALGRPPRTPRRSRGETAPRAARSRLGPPTGSYAVAERGPKEALRPPDVRRIVPPVVDARRVREDRHPPLVRAVPATELHRTRRGYAEQAVGYRTTYED